MIRTKEKARNNKQNQSRSQIINNEDHKQRTDTTKSREQRTIAKSYCSLTGEQRVKVGQRRATKRV